MSTAQPKPAPYRDDRHDAFAPALLDVVPWNHGYAHTWALRWLLTQPPLVERILRGIPGFNVAGPVRVVGQIRTEMPLRPCRPDLAFSLKDQHGTLHYFAVETKVNDPFRPEQVANYKSLRHQPILYTPGATGLFMLGVPSGGELRLSGANLARSLQGVGLPPLIQTYVNVVRAEAARIAAARALERGARAEPLQPGMSDEMTLLDYAWLVELKRELARRCAVECFEASLDLRIVAHDRGIFWRDSWKELVDENESGIYIEIFAGIRSPARTIAIKAGARSQSGRAATFDLAIDAGAPGPRWRRSARRVAHESVSIWKLAVTNHTLSATADAAIMARRWIDTVATAPTSGILTPNPVNSPSGATERRPGSVKSRKCEHPHSGR